MKGPGLENIRHTLLELKVGYMTKYRHKNGSSLIGKIRGASLYVVDVFPGSAEFRPDQLSKFDEDRNK